MKRTWSIAINTLLLTIKDKASFVWILLVPILYILIFGSAIKFDNDHTKAKAYLGIYNLDGDFLSAQVIAGLRSENIWVDSLQTLPAEPVTRLLIIPENFTTNLLTGTPVTLQLEQKTDADMEAAAAANIAIRKVQFRLRADLLELRMQNKEINAANITALYERKKLVTLNSNYAGNRKIIPSGFAFQLPANIVMFTMLMLFITSAANLVVERANGMLHRIFASPTHLLELYYGKLFGITLIGLFQIVLLLIVGKFIFQVDIGTNYLALFLLVLAFSTCCSAIGLWLGGMMNSEEKAVGLSLICALSMSAISGCWWPIEFAPEWNVKLASVLPSGIALDAFHQLFSYGNGLTVIYPSILFLLGIAILFSILFYFSLKKSRV